MDKIISPVDFIQSNIAISCSDSSCETCGKEFIQPSNYSRHLRIHTKERPYACTLCSAQFPYSTSLKRHQQRDHGMDLLSCRVCSKTFLNETSLIHHSLTIVTQPIGIIPLTRLNTLKNPVLLPIQYQGMEHDRSRFDLLSSWTEFLSPFPSFFSRMYNTKTKEWTKFKAFLGISFFFLR
ncbi:unnamed protein product [Echinostoma caproni]|uniref:C2H2-type domain-containing protein n=1 Tax=Echinostoma caproni TaxID=27848 RepID=A0A3P8HUU5_9TREM|nr:unnamed protein product [Echinostoma caproni]